MTDELFQQGLFEMCYDEAKDYVDGMSEQEKDKVMEIFLIMPIKCLNMYLECVGSTAELTKNWY